MPAMPYALSARASACRPRLFAKVVGCLWQKKLNKCNCRSRVPLDFTSYLPPFLPKPLFYSFNMFPIFPATRIIIKQVPIPHHNIDRLCPTPPATLPHHHHT